MLVERTADPSAAPDFLSSLAAPQSSCGFPYRKPHTLLSPVPRAGNPGTLGMTKGRATLPFVMVDPTGDEEGRATVPFVIPCAAEGSAVSLHQREMLIEAPLSLNLPQASQLLGMTKGRVIFSSALHAGQTNRSGAVLVHQAPAADEGAILPFVIPNVPGFPASGTGESSVGGFL